MLHSYQQPDENNMHCGIEMKQLLQVGWRLLWLMLRTCLLCCRRRRSGCLSRGRPSGHLTRSHDGEHWAAWPRFDHGGAQDQWWPPQGAGRRAAQRHSREEDLLTGTWHNRSSLTYDWDNFVRIFSQSSIGFTFSTVKKKLLWILTLLNRAQVLGKILVHELYIFYNNTEWN